MIGISLGLPITSPTSLVLGHGASGPTYPTVTSSTFWFDRFRNVYSDTAGTTPIAIDGTVGSWRMVGGAWGSALASQSTGSLQPIYKADGLQSASNDYLDFATATLSGDFTIYVVASKPDDTNNRNVFGDGTANNYFNFLFNFSNAYCDAVQSVDTVDNVYGSQIRRIRRSGSTWYYKRSGAAEVPKAGSSADFPISRLLGSTTFMHSTWRFMQLVAVNKLITPGDTDDLAIIAKLQELESGVTGP